MANPHLDNKTHKPSKHMLHQPLANARKQARQRHQIQRAVSARAAALASIEAAPNYLVELIMDGELVGRPVDVSKLYDRAEFEVIVNTGRV